MLVSHNGFDAKGQPVKNVADAASPTDAVNWGQVQAFLRGLRWKEPVRAAATANVTLSAPGASLDGVALATNDRLLLRAQTAGAENGIYVWTGSGSTLTRALDADSSAEVTGATVLVMEGSTYADKTFTQQTDGVTLGTTALSWVQAGGGGTTYTASNGLVLSGNAFSVQAASGGGIVVTSAGVSVDYSGLSRTLEGTLGDGTQTVFSIVHGWNKYVRGTVYNLATGQEEWADPKYVDANTYRFTFTTAPAAASYRYLIHG